LNFGSVSVGHPKFKKVVLSNSAKSGPPITFENNPDAFSVPATNPQEFGFPTNLPNNCPTQLLPKKKCTLTLEFFPASTGQKSSTLTIFDNAGNANQHISLQGSGK
jgi:hypothetical protein